MIRQPSALTVRAREFLSVHARRSPVDLTDPGRWYECTDVDGAVVPGPPNGLDRLVDFVRRFGGLAFCSERPACDGTHRNPYEFDGFVSSGWEELEDGDWTATVGLKDGYPLTLSWATGRIGVVEPDYWIADSATNLIESSALGQSIYAGDGWTEFIEPGGRGPGWGLTGITADAFHGTAPEVTEASSEWNRWYADEHIAIHGWRVTYEPQRSEHVMAWYRDPHGRRRIEAVVG